MTKGLRWILTALVGLVCLAGAASYAPDVVPAAPPPVRLEGDVVVTDPSQNELVVVPSPSVDLDDTASVATTTTATSPDQSIDDSSDSVDPPVGDSVESADDSAGSPDDG